MIPHITVRPRRSVRHATRASRIAWLTALLSATFVATLAAPPAPVAASTPMVTACADVNLRTSASTSATRKTTLGSGVSVRVVATVSGSSWSTTCAGRAVSGSKWYRIDAVNGRTVSALYGVSYLYGATGLFKAASTTAAPAPAGADSRAAELMRLVNLDRKALGKPALAIDPTLVAVADSATFTCPTKSTLVPKGRATDMALRSYFSHSIKGCLKSNGSAYTARDVLAVVFGYTSSRSELIHYNSAGTASMTYRTGCDINGANCKGGSTTTTKTIGTAQRSFMSSSTHRSVELGSYDRFGCGTSGVAGSARVYFACLYTVGGPSVLPAPTPAPTATATPAPTATPKTTLVTACADVNLRTSASTSATRKTTLGSGVSVRVVATVSGSSWSTTCAGRAVSGSKWYRIDAVNGRTVSALYGVSYLYGATGLFKAASTTAAEPTESAASTASPTPTLTPTPVPTPTPAPAPTPTPTPTASPAPTPAPTPTPTPAPTPSPSATPIAGVFTLGSSVTFHGRGYGHGVGLSQHGARGRALAGQDAATILAHYYRQTTIGTIPNAQIRVLVLDNHKATSGSPLTIYGRGGRFTIDYVSGTFPADARLRLTPVTSGTTTTWRMTVHSSNGTLLHSGTSTRHFRVRPVDSTTVLQLYSKPSSYDRYRGILRVITSGATADVINELPLETYLRGVVPAEMPSTYPTQALRAQAIAARSYAAYRLRPGVSTFDAYDDTRSQVYGGVLREKTATNSAIAATAGQAVLSGGAVANTLFHSTGGGATEHNENVFVSSTGAKVAGAVSYLRGSSDRAPDGKSYDAGSPYATWRTATYSRTQLSAWFATDSRTKVGTIAKLDLRRRGVSGRLISVTLIGSTGTTKTVSGDVFRSVFNKNRPSADPSLRSSLFALSPVP